MCTKAWWAHLGDDGHHPRLLGGVRHLEQRVVVVGVELLAHRVERADAVLLEHLRSNGGRGRG
jgi:hypothetical protein